MSCFKPIKESIKFISFYNSRCNALSPKKKRQSFFFKDCEPSWIAQAHLCRHFLVDACNPFFTELINYFQLLRYTSNYRVFSHHLQFSPYNFKKSNVLTKLGTKSIEIMVEKEENDVNQHFLLFPQCFFPYQGQVFLFEQYLICHRHMYSF